MLDLNRAVGRDECPGRAQHSVEVYWNATPEGIQSPDPSTCGGNGRKRGSQNKFTRALKDLILGALAEVGGQAYLVEQARNNPATFLTLVGKVLPLQVKAGGDDPTLPPRAIIHEHHPAAPHPAALPQPAAAQRPPTRVTKADVIVIDGSSQ